MKIFSSLVEPSAPIGLITIQELEGIQVLPYIRSRLVFADLAARTLNQGNFEHLLVDFPAFMNDLDWLGLPLKLFPLISIAAFRRSDGEPRAIAFTPNDAACIGTYLALEKSTPLYCLDDSDMLNYPKEAIFYPPVQTGDDYRVFQQGLEGYFKSLWRQMAAAWGQATAEQKFFTKYRAKKVIASLTEAGDFKQNSLFICEYQLLWAIQKLLREGVDDNIQFLFKWKDVPGVLMFEDPYFAWVRGILDDFPAANLEFWKGLKKKEGLPFDKLEVLENLLWKIITGGRAGAQYGKEKISREPSIRNLITFQRYLKKIIVTSQRYLPEAGNQLFHAAETCAGKEFLKLLADELLQYADSFTGEQINLIISSAGSIVIGGSGLDVPDYNALPSYYTGQPFSASSGREEESLCDSETEARKRILNQVHHKISRTEEKTFPKDDIGNIVRWEIKADYRFHAQACAQARTLIQQQMKQSIPKRTWGRMEGGIDWKATLSARARGEGGIYVKHRIYNAEMGSNGDEFTPVVFLFADKEEIDKSSSSAVHDGNLAQRNRDLENTDFPFKRHPPPDKVFSVYITSRKQDYLLDEHIKRESLTSLSLLYTKSIMGLERYQIITSRNKRYQCRIRPDDDPELTVFARSERGTAWAIKYAHDQVIVVAKKGWKASVRLAEFAKKKGIKIKSAPLSTYRPDFIKRLEICCLLSTRLKKHPQREQIVRRFV